MILHVPYLGEFRAEPVHVDGERAGLKFLCGAQAQAQLVDRLSALVSPETSDGEVGVIEPQNPPQDQPQDRPRAASA